jgi:hypothetical protein
MKNTKQKILKEFDKEFINYNQFSSHKLLKEFISKSIDQALEVQADQLEKERYWVACAGCPEGHSSFWKTVVESEYWKQWTEYANKNQLYDVDECRECGWIGKSHFDAFIDYITKRRIILRDKEWINQIQGAKIKEGWFDITGIKKSYNAVLDEIIRVMNKL